MVQGRAQAYDSFACDSQDDLSVLAALGDAGERGGRVRELKDRIDLGFQLAGVGKPGEREQLFAIRPPEMVWKEIILA